MSLLFIILNLFILYKIHSLRREKSKYLIYTAYIIFGVNVVYGIQWLLRELISTISLMCMETITKRIRLRFVYLFLCVFIILKIFGKFYTFGKSSLECFPNQNLCFDGNLCQLAPVNLALVNVKEERSHTE